MIIIMVGEHGGLRETVCQIIADHSPFGINVSSY